MSDTISPASRRIRKNTCRKCGRTVIVVEIDGRKVEADPELINVIPFEGPAEFLHARRAHADLCSKYQIEAEKAKMRAAMKAAGK